MPGANLAYTPELVTRLLEEAGGAEMRLRGRIGPASIRSCMPDTLRTTDDYSGPRRWAVPTPAQIAHLDQVKFRWMPLLGGELWHHHQRRRLVGLRSLIWPESDRDDPHVWSWRRLCDERDPHAPMPGVYHQTVKARFERAIDLLTMKLRDRPAPCAATLRRIRALQEGR